MTLHSSLNILLVEDNKEKSRRIEILLKELGYFQVTVAHDSSSALHAYRDNPPDICIIELDMAANSTTAIRLAEKIRESNCCIPMIMLSSTYSEKTYLSCRHLRPSSFIEDQDMDRLSFIQAFDFATQSYAGHNQNAIQYRKKDGPPPSNQNFFFRIQETYHPVPLSDIQYFYASEKQTIAKSGDKQITTSVSLKALEEMLAGRFVRIHKSYLVNINFLESIHPAQNSVWISGQHLPIGVSYRKSFFERLTLLG